LHKAAARVNEVGAAENPDDNWRNVEANKDLR
jgi:hypothetical protein